MGGLHPKQAHNEAREAFDLTQRQLECRRDALYLNGISKA